MKICNRCNTEKPLTEFYSSLRTKVNGEQFTYYRPDCIDCVKEKAKKWASENPESSKASKRKHNKTPFRLAEDRKRNRIRRKNGVHKTWQKNNKDKLYTYYLKRNEIKRHEISKEEWESCKEYFDYKCAYCNITEDEHKETHKQQLHKEHAIDKGDNGISNCIPACKLCNSSKRDRDFDEWYVESNPVFDVHRLEKINQWLNSDWKLVKIQ